MVCFTIFFLIHDLYLILQNGIRPEDISQDKTNSRRKDRNNPIDQSDQESITHVEIMDARDVQPRLAPRILPSLSPGD